MECSDRQAGVTSSCLTSHLLSLCLAGTLATHPRPPGPLMDHSVGGLRGGREGGRKEGEEREERVRGREGGEVRERGMVRDSRWAEGREGDRVD